MSADLTILELSGCVTRLPGDRYCKRAKKNTEPNKRSAQNSRRLLDQSLSTGSAREIHTEIDLDKSLPAEIKQNLNLTVCFFRQYFHGFSRKYLQNYLIHHWSLLENRLWKERCIFKLCLNFGPITNQAVYSYVSPQFVKMVLPLSKYQA